MTITKEYFVDLQEKYIKVRKLVEEECKSDPENEPYMSKYSARQILIGMKARVEYLLRSQVPNSKGHIRLTGMLGVIYLELGVICIDTEELTAGEKHLEKCQETIEQYHMKPEIIMITLNNYNQFGILWSQREPEKSKIYLETAESLYKKFKSGQSAPHDISGLFMVENEQVDEELGWKNFEKVYTFTLYYLAQIYGALKDALKSSVYCHTTLKRQLESDSYEAIDWALNAATLSQFFMEKNGFKQARHHLAASLYILSKHEKYLDSITERDEAYEAKKETFLHRSADVARCWAKYGLNLLLTSKERLLSNTEDIDKSSDMISDLAKIQLDSDSTVSLDDLQNLYFPSLDLSIYENQITDQYILTLEDARVVFMNAQEWLVEAQSYYSLENHASDYIQIILDKTQLYLNLLFFDDNPENQAKYHKRRADLLEDTLNKVNSQYYMQYCRQMWFELGRTYSDILDIKADKLKETSERPSPHALSKINALVEKSIQNFTQFIDSLKESAKIPDNLHEELQRAYLRATVYIAALHGRYISLDKSVQLENIQSSLLNYKIVVEFCDKHPKAKDLIPSEIAICREMVHLLPVKISKIEHELII